ncbi:hypothetical protein FRB93_002567 [Tulasnella sp. JGI-2019a]|nr:hypothetical protein FRB93_002567 [Tulasnella sp. JGI-2019a]
MARSDRSSDPDDGSITSDEEQPASPIAPPAALPTTSTSASQAAFAKATSMKSQASRRTSIWQEALEMPVTTHLGPAAARKPNARFKAAVLKVIGMHRMSSKFESHDEPGVDPRSPATTALYGHIRAQCSIEVVDYGAVKYRSAKLSNHELEDFLSHEANPRPLWSKVRWINIGGVSWDVIKCLALRYNIHPLAIEDTLHNHQTYSSKADYYSQHLFIRLLCHTLAQDSSSQSDPTRVSGPTYTSQPAFTVPPGENTKFEPSSSFGTNEKHTRSQTDPIHYDGREPRPMVKTFASAVGANRVRGAEIVDPEGAWIQTLAPDVAGVVAPITRKHSQQTRYFTPPTAARQSTAQATVNALKEGDRVAVDLKNMFIFFFRDGTLITIHQDPGSNLFDPVSKRLRQRDTLLRNTSDASMLLQNVLDLVVDNAVLVVEKYQQELLKWEGDILIKPKVSTVRSLHIASGDIAMLKRTLDPIKTLIYGLRRYDLDRCIATANSRTPGFDEKKIEGFLSHKTKIYLADVMDHMDYILASLDMFGTITENLIGYTFNVVSYDMNTTVNTLTVLSVIFFPLSFLTGYFGMNFISMDSVQMHSELMFWEVALPVMVVVTLIASWPAIIRMVHYFRKRKLQNAVRTMTK